MKKDNKIKKYIILVFELIFIAMLIYSLIEIAIWYINNIQNKEINKQMQNSIIIETNKENETKEEKYDIDFNTLKQTNIDIIGFLKVNGTNIETIVVKGNDNEYYLNHNLEKKYNKAGWVFADYKNKLDLTDKNIIIYGHNMKDSSMFGTLENILKEEWYNNEQNRKLTFITENEQATYEVFSVYKIENEDYYITTEGNISINSINSLKMAKPGNASITVSAYGLMKTLNIVAINLNVGDVNYDNKIDVNDMIIIQQVADGNADVDDVTLVLCDVNGDNKVDEKDVEEIAKIIGFETDETFTVSTEVFNKVSYQAYLIEPWAMRATVRFTDAEGTTIDVAGMQDYGVYAIRAGMLDALEEGEVTIKDIILDSDSIYYGMSDTEGEGMWATGDGRATFSFDDGLFTYRLSEEIYWVAYCKDADGKAHFTTYKTKSLSAIAETLVASSSTNVYIKAILEDMLVMEEAIVDYRSDFDNLTDLEPSNPNTIGDCEIDFGPAATDGKYAIGNSYRVSLIEPWSIRLIARIYDTTDEDTSSTDHIDYSMADDYGVIVFQDIDGTHGNMTSYEDLLALENAYVYSKSQGNMGIDPNESNKVSAGYDKDIFTYQLDKDIYCVSFVKIDGKFYYSKLLTRNMHTFMSDSIANNSGTDKLLKVYDAMIEMYESVQAYHESL